MSLTFARHLAQRIVQSLEKQGHLVVAAGQRERVTGDLAGQMVEGVTEVLGRLPPPGLVAGDVTSTFGDDRADERVEDMVDEILDFLLDSEGIEEVFAEDAVLNREIFRVMKEVLRSREAAEVSEAGREPAASDAEETAPRTGRGAAAKGGLTAAEALVRAALGLGATPGGRPNPTKKPKPSLVDDFDVSEEPDDEPWDDEDDDDIPRVSPSARSAKPARRASPADAKAKAKPTKGSDAPAKPAPTSPVAKKKAISDKPAAPKKTAPAAKRAKKA